MSETTADLERLLAEAEAVTNDRNYAKIPDVLSESYVGHMPGEVDDLRGRDGFEAWLREFEASFPDFEFRNDDVLFGDGKVMMEWTLTGTHEGEYNGVPPTGNTFELSGMSKFRIEDGKIAEEYMYFDPQEFFSQLGVTNTDERA